MNKRKLNEDKWSVVYAASGVIGHKQDSQQTQKQCMSRLPRQIISTLVQKIWMSPYTR